MRIPKVMALINALTACTLLLIQADMRDVNQIKITPADLLRHVKETGTDFPFDILTANLDAAHWRADLFEWLTIGVMALLAANTACWVLMHGSKSDV